MFSTAGDVYNFKPPSDSFCPQTVVCKNKANKQTNKQSQNKHNTKSIAQTSEQYTKSFTVWHSYVLSPNYGVSNQAPEWSGYYFNLSSCTTTLLIKQDTFSDRTLAWYSPGLVLYCVCHKKFKLSFIPLSKSVFINPAKSTCYSLRTVLYQWQDAHFREILNYLPCLQVPHLVPF